MDLKRLRPQLERHAKPWAHELETALSAADAAGEVVLRYHGQALAVERKDRNEPVTAADRESSEVIVAHLSKAFPGDAVVSEEAQHDRRHLHSQRVWYVDPIDGTSDFIAGRQSYAVMIGLAVDHEPVVGVLYQPNHRSVVIASRGHGAYSIGHAGFERLQVSAVERDDEARLMTSSRSHGPDRERILRTLGIASSEHIGGIGIKLSAIAMGACDLYVSPQTRASTWDTCAPEVIVCEAGGRVSNLQGAPLRYDRDTHRHPNGIVVSNGRLHDSVIARLAELYRASRSDA